MILKLSMKHQAKQLYKVCINHDPGITLTYLMARPTEVTRAFESGNLLKYDLKGKTCKKWTNGQKIYVYEKNVLRGLSAPAPGLYTAVHVHIIFKHLL